MKIESVTDISHNPLDKPAQPKLLNYPSRIYGTRKENFREIGLIRGAGSNIRFQKMQLFVFLVELSSCLDNLKMRGRSLDTRI